MAAFIAFNNKKKERKEKKNANSDNREPTNRSLS